MPMPTGNGENPQFYGLTELTVCYDFNKTKKSISLDSRFVDLGNTGLHATLTASGLIYSV